MAKGVNPIYSQKSVETIVEVHGCHISLYLACMTVGGELVLVLIFQTEERPTLTGVDLEKQNEND